MSVKIAHNLKASRPSQILMQLCTVLYLTRFYKANLTLTFDLEINLIKLAKKSLTALTVVASGFIWRL